MEQLNRIELKGIVGAVRVTPVGDKKVVRFSMATSYAFKDHEENSVIETTWHNVSIWDGPQCPDLDKLQKGSNVHVIGRICTMRYIDSNGCERTVYEVKANQVEILDNENQD